MDLLISMMLHGDVFGFVGMRKELGFPMPCMKMNEVLLVLGQAWNRGSIGFDQRKPTRETVSDGFRVTADPSFPSYSWGFTPFGHKL